MIRAALCYNIFIKTRGVFKVGYSNIKDITFHVRSQVIFYMISYEYIVIRVLRVDKRVVWMETQMDRRVLQVNRRVATTEGQVFKGVLQMTSQVLQVLRVQ